MTTKYLFVICLTLTLPLPLSALAQGAAQDPAGAEARPATAPPASAPGASPSAAAPVAPGSTAEQGLSPQGSPGATAARPGAGAAKGAPLLDDLSPEVVKKLDARQLERLIRQRTSARAKGMGGDSPTVSILVPLFFFLCLGGIVGGSLYYRHRQNGHRHQTLRLMIEKGAEIPPELLSPPVKPRSDLRRGILLLAGGVGLMIFLALVSTGDSPQRMWSLGLIPSLVGVGYLVVWKLESKQSPVG